jgi:hypothetical protein
MVKRFLQIALVLAGCIALPGWAMLIASGPYVGTDAGAVDNFIDGDAKAGAPGNGTAWVNSTLPTTVDITFRIGDVNYYTADTPGVSAAALTGQPSYFC